MASDKLEEGRERLPWVATLIWLAFVATTIYLKGLPYDSEAKLSLGDWADIADLVSAIVAPIAVLWVVRSFYVQKRELAAAVRAAEKQSEALNHQVRMIELDRKERLSPSFFVRYKRTLSQEENRWVQNHKISLLNVGAGAAYEAHFHIVGDNNGKGGWLEISTAIDAIPPGQSKGTSVVSYVNLLEHASTRILVELSYKNREKDELKAYYRINLQSSWQKTVSGTELTREEYLKEMKLGKHPIPSSFAFNAIDAD